MVVAYVELMLLTSLISYLAARIVVRGYSHSVIVVFLLCLLQAFFSFSLIWGVKRERLEFLLISVASLGVRLIFAATYLVAIVATHIVPVKGGSFLEYNVVFNTTLSITFIIVYGFCISVVTRLHAYYTKLHATILGKNAKNRRCLNCCADMFQHYTNHLSSQYTTNVLQEMGGSETFTRRSSTEHCNLINTRERLKSVAVTNTLYENSDESENEG
ncbi:unnamed protein product [Toxocara canis]|uniref:Transmembrane protein n=1 Tax=Toxocara canis TaxID=6265 RepID=A0A183U0Z3_TOXCA|nr:unnamed protein product [Toxocara canis]